MTINVEDKGAQKVIHLAGELTTDDDTIITTAANLPQSESAGIVIDLANVSFINSTGLNTLIRMVAQANTREQRIIFAAPTAFIEGVFQATKLDRFFEIVPTVDEALAKLAG